jgi:FSR family fosmidomycin resistance protein-like MFS transporter
LDLAHPDSFRRDARVIGIVGFAHLMSHFFQLALPPLFPLLRAEFGTSYAVLGTLVGVYYAASGVSQFASGFAVDRLGAGPILLAGLALAAGGTMVASLVPGIGWLFPIVALMGVGNGVFHPSDFAILNANVAPRRLGHAYSSHGIGGNLGYALAPVVSFALGAAFGWRFALAGMGAIGLVALAIMASQRALLVSHRAADSHLHTVKGSAALFLQLPILLCFFYFVFVTIGGLGLQTFIPTVLGSVYGVSLALATSTLTAYLLGSAAGILAGGFLAARTARHDRVAASGMLLAAVVLGVVATGAVPSPLLLPVFVLIGFALGSTGPSRDLIVRAATPKGAAGRVYGFVYSGLDLGGIIGPVAFGFLLDHGHSREMLLGVAACYLLAIGTVIRVRRASSRRTALARQVA